MVVIMKDEIKEILEQLKIRNNLYNDRDESCIVPIKYYEAHILLDYITNLQDKIDKALKLNEQIDDYLTTSKFDVKYELEHLIVEQENILMAVINND